jgi:hypothetical protein
MLNARLKMVGKLLAAVVLFAPGPSQAQLDCNSNGIDDPCDLSCGPPAGPCDVPNCAQSADCNANGIPDECDIANCPSWDLTCADCQPNGIPDACDLRTTGNGFTLRSSWSTYDPGTNGLGIDAVQFNGAVYDERYIYFAPGRSNVLQYDTNGPLADPASWDAYNPRANGGYSGAVFDGQYVYFAPIADATGFHGEVLRYDTTGGFPAPASWAVYDYGSDPNGCATQGKRLGIACTDPDGYNGLAFDGQFVYFSPYDNGTAPHGEVLRYDKSGNFANPSSWVSYDPGVDGVGTQAGYNGAVVAGRYVYFVPYNRINAARHGEVLRYDRTGAFVDPASWAVYDYGSDPNGCATQASRVDVVCTDPDGYAGAVFDGRYIYYVPLHNGASWHGEVLRYDTTADFGSSSSWMTYDPGANGLETAPVGYFGAAFDGRYVYFSPYQNGDGFHGEVLRYDTMGDFANVASWKTYDPGANDVGTDPDGFAGAVFDGRRYIYFAPYHNGVDFHGEVLRFDIFSDCNANGIPDECDIADCPPLDASCQDCNLDGVPDGCVPPCGDMVCTPACGEDQCTCAGDCGTPPVNELECTDNIDNDCDGLIDCADPDCAFILNCFCDASCTAPENPCDCPQDCGPNATPEGPGPLCTDGVDNDCDGFVDCADPDCATCDPCSCCDGVCLPDEECVCEVDCGTPPAIETQCSDGLDNDCDGDIDCADSDCAPVCPLCRDGACLPGETPCNCQGDCGLRRLERAGPPFGDVCTDGIDNDCDGRIDCADPGCADDPTCTLCCQGDVNGNDVVDQIDLLIVANCVFCEGGGTLLAAFEPGALGPGGIYENSPASLPFTAPLDRNGQGRGVKVHRWGYGGDRLPSPVGTAERPSIVPPGLMDKEGASVPTVETVGYSRAVPTARTPELAEAIQLPDGRGSDSAGGARPTFLASWTRPLRAASRVRGSVPSACDVNCDGAVNLLDFGIELCLLFFPPDQCCGRPHGGCTNTNFVQTCFPTTPNVCELIGGAYSGDGVPCPRSLIDCDADLFIDECECGPHDVCICRQNDPNGGCIAHPGRFGDVDCTGKVDVDDLVCVVAGYADYCNCPNADVDGAIDRCIPDGDVDVDDLVAIVLAYGGGDPCGCGGE